MRIFFYNGSSNEVKPKISYTVETFFSIYGLEYESVSNLDKLNPSAEDLILIYDLCDKYESISKRFQGTSIIFIADCLSSYFFTSTNKELTIATLEREEPSFSIPVFLFYPCPLKYPTYFLKDKNGEPLAGIEKDDHNLIVYADVLGSSFYLLSLQEEVENKRRDKHNRFLAKYSFRKNEELISTPLVNEYFKLLFTLILAMAESKKIPLVRKAFWSKGSRLAIALTHDIDILDKWYLYIFFVAWRLLRKLQIGKTIKVFFGVIRSVLNGKNPLFSFDKIIQEENRYNYKSSFCFICKKPSLVSILRSDSNYDLNKKNIKEKITELKKAGNEISLHGSYFSYNNREMLNQEKENLEKVLGSKVRGNRQHFLRMDLPKMWRIEEECGFSYDATLGFADESGFRSGLAFPFYPYDNNQNEKMNILELNHNVMDQTYEKYQSKDIGEIESEIFKMIESVERPGGGLITINWHSNMVEEFGFSGFVELYQRILQYISQKGCFAGSAESIANWWTARGELKLREYSRKGKERKWEYDATKKIDDLIFQLYNVAEYQISIEGAKGKISLKNGLALIDFCRLEKGQKFSLILKRNEQKS